MILYVDTSAVVRALLLEPGSSDVERWYADADEVAASVITYAENLRGTRPQRAFARIRRRRSRGVGSRA